MALAGLSADIGRIEAACRRVRPAAFGVPFCPFKPTPLQMRFLACEAREAFYGGAAGGGKSIALLMRAALYVDRPQYRALLLRRSFPDLSQPGALMDLAQKWFGPTDAKWSDKAKTWTFPSGAKIVFGYADNLASIEKIYQGAAYHFIGIDELGQWRKPEYTYLFSRCRKEEGDDIPLALRASGNPGGIGHRWVKERFIDAASRGSRAFIPAKLVDNPHLDQATYRENLAELDAIKRAQLEEGQWIESIGDKVYPLKGEFEGLVWDAVGQWPASSDEWRLVLAVDIGTSLIVPSTAYVLLAYSPFSRVVWAIRAWTKAGETPHSIADEIERVRSVADIERCVIDTGGLGEGYRKDFTRRFGTWFDAAEKRDKLGQRHIALGCLQRGDLKVDSSCTALIKECDELKWDEERLDVDESTPDHITDALLYGNRACRAYLARERPATPQETEEERMLRLRIESMESTSWIRQ